MMQKEEKRNPDEVAELVEMPPIGRLMALDLGTKRIGVAVSDELRVTTRGLAVISRASWKKLLQTVKHMIAEYDAKALIIGLPLETDGSESDMSREARRLARNFSLSLDIPVVLQDERVTSYEAKQRLWNSGRTIEEACQLVDSEAAAIILADYIDRTVTATKGSSS
jgi:putative holliday junction resolvase